MKEAKKNEDEIDNTRNGHVDGHKLEFGTKLKLDRHETNDKTRKAKTNRKENESQYLQTIFIYHSIHIVQ